MSKSDDEKLQVRNPTIHESLFTDGRDFLSDGVPEKESIDGSLLIDDSEWWSYYLYYDCKVGMLLQCSGNENTDKKHKFYQLFIELERSIFSPWAKLLHINDIKNVQ